MSRHTSELSYASRPSSSRGGFASTSGSAEPDSTRPGTGNSDTSPPKPKVDVSHFPHYGLKRGMACTFCRRRKLRCSGDRPSCTNCVKYTKTCEYEPPVKDPKKQAAKKSPARGYTARMVTPQQPMPHPQAMPLYSSQVPTMPLDYADAESSTAVYVDQHLGFVSPPGNASYQPGFGPYHPQQPGYITPPIPATQSMPPQGSFAQPMPPPTVGVNQYVSPPPGSSFSNFSASSQHWAPATPVLPGEGTAPGFLTPMLPPIASHNPLMADFTTVEPVYDPKLRQLGPGKMDQLSSGHSTPEDQLSVRPSSSDSAEAYSPDKLASRLYLQTPSLHHVADSGVIDGLTDRLGEFLFSPALNEEDPSKRRKSARPSSGAGTDSRGGSPRSTSLPRTEYDGLSDASRALLLDCFLKHSELFFEMSIPRFRYRMTFSDRRRPSLALLNAMYMWATRISEGGLNSSMEKQFFDAACKHIHVTMATTDRLLDAVRASYLLSIYSFLSARHHEGWCLAGIAVRLVLSCGLHKIKSCTLKPVEAQDPFLRHQSYILPPPEDTVELGERIHAFWSIFAIDRCGALSTAYPASFNDEDITTPFPVPLSEISNGNVTERDDRSLRHLCMGREFEGVPDSNRSRWVKCTAVLERASKIAFKNPEKDSPYDTAWSQFTIAFQQDASLPTPPDYLNQPKFRNPRSYHECILAVEAIVKSNGDDGIFPPTRRAQALGDGAPEPEITTSVIMFHHMVSAIQMVLHDIDSTTADNTEALKAARKSVQLFQVMPEIPYTDVDAFIVQVWFLVAKTLVKEVHRFMMLGDTESAHIVAGEADVVARQISRIGHTMHLAKSTSVALDDLRAAALASPPSSSDRGQVTGLNLEHFMFPQHLA